MSVLWYRRENGVIVGGPYNCDQPAFVVEALSADHPDVAQFNATCQANRAAAIAAELKS